MHGRGSLYIFLAYLIRSEPEEEYVLEIVALQKVHHAASSH